MLRVIMDDNSKTPDQLIAELKLKGMKNKDIAPIVYPKLSLDSAIVKVSRHSKLANQYLDESKALVIADMGITWRTILDVYKEAIEATKAVVHGKDSEDGWVDVVPDYPVRITAAKELSKHLPPENSTPINPLEDLDLSNMDTLELKQAIFKRTQ